MTNGRGGDRVPVAIAGGRLRQLIILWTIYGSVYDQPGTINLYGPEYGQPVAIKKIRIM